MFGRMLIEKRTRMDLFNTPIKPRVLHLTLSRKPFEVMVTGEKKTEFRCQSPWIVSRIRNKTYDFVRFVNGYGEDKPYFVAVYGGFEIETKPNEYTYSNGLVVNTDAGTVKIHIGEIIERGNLRVD
jgi:hypothetical protein